MTETAEVQWNNQGEWEPLSAFEKGKEYATVVVDNQTLLPKKLRFGESEYLSSTTYNRMSEGLTRATEMLGAADEKSTAAEREKKAAEAERDSARKAVRELSSMHAPNDDGFCDICDEISCATYVTASEFIESWEPKADEPEAVEED